MIVVLCAVRVLGVKGGFHHSPPALSVPTPLHDALALLTALELNCSFAFATAIDARAAVAAVLACDHLHCRWHQAARSQPRFAAHAHAIVARHSCSIFVYKGHMIARTHAYCTVTRTKSYFAELFVRTTMITCCYRSVRTAPLSTVSVSFNALSLMMLVAAAATDSSC